jgi:hypothetical protein
MRSPLIKKKSDRINSIMSKKKVIMSLQNRRSQIQTDQQFPSVGSQTKGLLVNADGSVDLYFGPKPLAGKENNWVQTNPGTGWNTILRLYGPLEPWFDKTWRHISV